MSGPDPAAVLRRLAAAIRDGGELWRDEDADLLEDLAGEVRRLQAVEEEALGMAATAIGRARAEGAGVDDAVLAGVLRRAIGREQERRGYVALLEGIDDDEDPVGPSLTIDVSVELERNELEALERLLGPAR